jgi:hypothetical protein
VVRRLLAHDDLGPLARAVSQVPYWHNDFEDDNKTTRAPFRGTVVIGHL